jgi:molecular chaperone GrpE
MANMTPPKADEREVEVSSTDLRAPVDEEVIDHDRARLARAVNDLEAAKVRVQRDAAIVREETRSKLVTELLPVLDNFDRAIGAAESNGDAPSVVEGMRLIHRQLERVLEGYGLVRFDAVGAAFDPVVHDATNMIAVADPKQDRVVVAQNEPGYMFGDRLLRAAKVVVGKYA